MEIRDDVLAAKILASLKPEPWELKKKMASPKQSNRLKRKVQQRFDTNDADNSS